MYALKGSRQANVGAVVHDQRDPVAQRTPQFARMAQHLARVAHLVAVLNQSGAAVGQIAGVLHNGGGGAQGSGKAGNIDDGVQLRKIHIHHGGTETRSSFQG